MASTNGAAVEARLVQFVDGAPHADAGSVPTREPHPAVTAHGKGRVQPSTVGSHADLPLPLDWASGRPLLVRCWVFPTTAGAPPDGAAGEASENMRMAGRAAPIEARRQVIWAIGRAGSVPAAALVFTADGRIAIEVAGTVAAATGQAVRSRIWHGTLVTIADGMVRLDVCSSPFATWDIAGAAQHAEAKVEAVPLRDADLFRLARGLTDGSGADCMNGKIARPSLSAGASPADVPRLLGSPGPLPGRMIAAWDLSRRPESDVVVDTGPGKRHGRTTNLPARAMTGPFWRPDAGTVFALTPEHDAIHFHADDVGDLGWEPTLQLRLPDDLGSGIYAIRVSGADGFMHVPLFVRPAAPRARVAFLASTNTYLAYANHRMFLGNDELHHLIADHPVGPNDRDVLVLDHPFLGRSPYDTHDDGSGVHMASWNRPLISFEPAARDFLAAGPRNFQADLYVVGLLERSGLGYDVITDEILHEEGIAALKPYDVVLTGSHPEYWSRAMLAALRAYLADAGRLMYLGGNGFYWATGFTGDRTAIEIRRSAGGTRAWDAEPAEIILSTTGEAGGTWRLLGLPPQATVGVGFTSQGWGGGHGYQRLPDSFDARVAGFFEGIGPEETIGDFGIVMDGAAGDELDRLDYGLGTPPNALRLATALPFPDHYQLAVEEVRNMTPTFGGSQTDLVRADMVWLDLPGGGEVFSVGSVSWPASIGWNGGDNNVACLTANVLRTMLSRASAG